jgi:hypothetical protein
VSTRRLVGLGAWAVTYSAGLLIGAPSPVAASGSSTASSQGQAIVTAAASEHGVPYCLGGGSTTRPTKPKGCGFPSSFDCSGLAMYAVFQATGVSLPHDTTKQSASSLGGTLISEPQLQPGDLVFFGVGSLANAAHVGIYAGIQNGLPSMWDANTAFPGPYPRADGVQLTSLKWEEADPAFAFVGAVRYAQAGGGGSASYDLRQFYVSNGAWTAFDVSAATGVTIAGDPTDGPGGLVARDANGHLRQFYVSNGAWTAFDVSAATGVTIAGDPTDGPGGLFADGT